MRRQQAHKKMRSWIRQKEINVHERTKKAFARISTSTWDGRRRTKWYEHMDGRHTFIKEVNGWSVILGKRKRKTCRFRSSKVEWGFFANGLRSERKPGKMKKKRPAAPWWRLKSLQQTRRFEKEHQSNKQIDLNWAEMKVRKRDSCREWKENGGFWWGEGPMIFTKRSFFIKLLFKCFSLFTRIYVFQTHV